MESNHEGMKHLNSTFWKLEHLAAAIWLLILELDLRTSYIRTSFAGNFVWWQVPERLQEIDLTRTAKERRDAENMMRCSNCFALLPC